MEAKNFKIAAISRLSEQLYNLELEGEFSVPPVPGQFIHIKIDNSLFLRRPFSIACHENKRFTILFQVVGEGTRILSRKKEGDIISVIGPLGKGFPVNKSWKTVYMIGGGTGIAPLIFLSKKLFKNGADIMFFYGAKNRNGIAFQILPAGINYIFATEDGSYGHKGLLNNMILKSAEKTGKPDIIFAGGPYGMLKKISDISEKLKVPAFVSMENRMACGTGICYGCVTKIKSGGGWEYKRICKEGPVFSTKEIQWEKPCSV